MKSKTYQPGSNDPVWLEEGHRINEAVFCETFMSTHKIIFCNGFFFTEDGRVTDEMPLRSTIYAELRDYASSNIARKVGNILDLLKPPPPRWTTSGQLPTASTWPMEHCTWMAAFRKVSWKSSVTGCQSDIIPQRPSPSTGCGSCPICSTRRIPPPYRSLSVIASFPATRASG